VRQRRDAHSGGNHLNQQQGVIHAFQLWADARWLEEMTPDIQSAALNRVNQQRFRGQVFRADTRFGGQRMVRGQHQTHLEIKHRGIM